MQENERHEFEGKNCLLKKGSDSINDRRMMKKRKQQKDE